MRLCSVEGCGRLRNSHGYCSTHYRRLQKFGTLEPQRRAKGTGSIHRSGYAVITRAGVTSYVHRLVWEEAHGPLPEGWHVHHLNGDTLDNRLENLVALPGVKHARLHGKLTDEQVEAIRQRYVSGKVSHRELAEEFGVSQSNITLILQGKRWH